MKGQAALLFAMALLGAGLAPNARAAEADRGAPDQTAEREIPPHAMTAPAWDTLAKEAEGARIERIEIDTEASSPVYVAEIVTAQGDRYEIQIDVDGKLLKKELESPARGD